MTDELGRRLTERVDAATPDTLAPYAEVVARRDRRRTRRRVGAVVAAVVAVGAVASAAALATGPSEERGGPPVATQTPSSGRSALVVPSGGHDGPPPIVVRGDGAQLDTWQGSYCWEHGCADMISPPWDELPVVGAAETVDAGFTDPGAVWSVSLANEHRCATYPVMLTPTGPGTYELTPSGPAGEYRGDVFLYPSTGGDTSGAFRWTTPGTGAPQSWAHLHQDTPSSGGEGVVQVVLDRAGVDGDVSGTVTVSGAKGTQAFDLVAADQGCAGDRYVTLAPHGQPYRKVDGLGSGPFTYDVDVVVGGTRHHATATSADGAEDTPLRFEPALPE